MYDLETSMESPICVETQNQGEPSIWDDRIVWQDSRDLEMDVYLYKLDEWAPTSSTETITPYWHISIPVSINATASDVGGSGLKNVTLMYRYSTDNITWGLWDYFDVDNDPWDNISWDFTFPEGEGYYQFYTSAADNASNVEGEPPVADASCGLDVTDPLADAGPDVKAGTQFLQDGTASDNGSGVATCNWSVVSGPGNVVFGTPAGEDTTISADTDGTYIIRLNVTDNVGRWAYDEFTLLWDSVSPSSYVLPISVYWHTSGPLIVHANASDGGGSGLRNITLWFRYSTGNVTFGTNTSFGVNAEPWSDVSWDFDFPYGDGYYEFYSIAVDNASNVESAPIIHDALCAFDTTLPSVDAGPDVITNAQILQDGSASDLTSGINSYLWTKVSGPGLIIFGSETAEDTTVSADADGTYVIRLNATDNAGNWVYDEFTLIWDTSQPTSIVDALSRYWTNENVRTINVTASDTEPSGLRNVTLFYQYSSDNITFGEATLYGVNTEPWLDVSWDFDFPYGDGYYEFYSIAVDNATNIEGAPVINDALCAFDTTFPSVDAGLDAMVNAQILQDGSASDSISGIDSYKWTKVTGPGSILFGSDNTEDTTISADADGTYVISLNVTDRASNRASDEFTLVWDNSPPTSSVNTISPYWTNTSVIAINVTANDAGLGGLRNVTLLYRYSSDNITFGQNITYSTETTPWSGISFTFDFPNGDGYYQFYSVAVDNTSNFEQAPISIDTICARDTIKPSVDTASNMIVNSKFLINANASDVISGIETYYWTQVSGPGSISFGSQFSEQTTITADAEGRYSARVTVNDKAGNFEFNEFEFILDWTCPSISLISPANNSHIQAGISINFDITDSNLDSVNYSINGGGDQPFGPPYEIISEGWSCGTYNIEIHAVDKAGNKAQNSYVFLVDYPPPQVVSTSPINNSLDVALDLPIIIEFDKPLNETSLEDVVTSQPQITISGYDLNSEKNILTIILAANLDQNTTYMITVKTTGKDAECNTLISLYYFLFTTLADNDLDGLPDSQDPDDDNDGIPDEKDLDPFDPEIGKDTGEPGSQDTDMIWIFLIVIIIICIIILVLILGRRKEVAEENGQAAQSPEPKPESTPQKDEENIPPPETSDLPSPPPPPGA